MSELCKCGDGLSNLGVPSCKEGFDVAKRLIFVEQLDNDGNPNAIDVADVLDSTYLDGKFYNADKSQRWFITPDFDNVTDERADTETQTLDSGIELPLRQGQRTFTAFFQTLPASWGRKIGLVPESHSCSFPSREIQTRHKELVTRFPAGHPVQIHQKPAYWQVEKDSSP